MFAWISVGRDERFMEAYSLLTNEGELCNAVGMFNAARVLVSIDAVIRMIQ